MRVLRRRSFAVALAAGATVLAAAAAAVAGSVAASSRPASGTPVHPSPPQDLRSQEQPIAEIRRAAQSITAAEVKAHADYLGSDALMGRATPSPGQDSAA